MGISGTARSSTVRSVETDDILFQWDPAKGVSQFALNYTPGGHQTTLGVEDHDTLGIPVLVFEQLAAGINDFVLWHCLDDQGNRLVLPRRYVIDFAYGPRDVAPGTNYGANQTPIILPFYQDSSHGMMLFKHGADPAQTSHCIFNGVSVSTGYSCAVGIEGGNAGDDPTPLRLTVESRLPASGVDPAGNMLIQGWDNVTRTEYRQFVGSYPIASGPGGSPPGAWDAGWQSGAAITAGIGTFEHNGGAGKSFISMFTIRRHPADLKPLDVTTSLGRRISQGVVDEQTGTTPKTVASFYLPAGTLKSTSKAFIGTTTAAPDQATLELRADLDSSLVATWTKQGPLGSSQLSSNATIPAPGWYYAELKGSAGGVVAQIQGVDLEVV